MCVWTKSSLCTIWHVIQFILKPGGWVTNLIRGKPRGWLTNLIRGKPGGGYGGRWVQ